MRQLAACLDVGAALTLRKLDLEGLEDPAAPLERLQSTKLAVSRGMQCLFTLLHTRCMIGSMSFLCLLPNFGIL